MKYLKTYKKLGIKEGEVFEYFINTLSNSIFTWEYFVNFGKIKNNILKIEKELNLLNTLIGKENIESEFIELIQEYPKVREVLPILIAIRRNRFNQIQIIDDFENLETKNKSEIFNYTKKITPDLKKELLIFYLINQIENNF